MFAVVFVPIFVSLLAMTHSADLSNAVKVPISEKTREKIMKQWYMDITGGLMLGLTNQMYKLASPANRKRLGSCTAKATSVGKYAKCMDQLATALEKPGGRSKAPLPAGQKFKPISDGKDPKVFLKRMVGGVRSKEIPGLEERIQENNDKVAEQKELTNTILSQTLGGGVFGAKIFSPTILNSKGSSDAKVFSPDILSLDDPSLGPSERNFITQMQSSLAGLKDIKKGNDAEQEAKDWLKANNIPEESDFVKFYGPKTRAAFNAYDDLVKSLGVAQTRELTQKGYTWMNQAQANKFYRAIKETPPNVKELSRMTENNRDKALVNLLKEHQGANEFRVSTKDLKGTPVVKVTRRSASGRRQKRSPSVLEPKTFAPSVNAPSVMGGAILSPSVFNPAILSPDALTPVILSPSVSGPVILSPNVLHPTILSPQAFTATILSPAALSPIILSPVAIGATILSPSVLSPVILSPSAISATILSPCLLGPAIDSPSALSVSVLSPAVLC